jgi:hypothetical protein
MGQSASPDRLTRCAAAAADAGRGSQQRIRLHGTLTKDIRTNDDATNTRRRNPSTLPCSLSLLPLCLSNSVRHRSTVTQQSGWYPLRAMVALPSRFLWHRMFPSLVVNASKKCLQEKESNCLTGRRQGE